MSEIKAIETEYNGYRFRSRLEARWAVFFDIASIKYLYEYQGFVLNDSRNYLPDFYLPKFNVFVEIKSDRSHDDGKARKFAESFTDFDKEYGGIILCYGDPMNDDLIFMTQSECDEDGGGWYENECFFGRELSSGEKLIIMYNDYKQRLFHNTTNVETFNKNSMYCEFSQAERLARQTRFEDLQ